MRTLIWLLAAAFSLGSACSWADSLTARVDRTNLSLEQTLNLQLTYDGRSNDEPDLTALEQNFEILSRSHSSSFTMSNGQASSSTRWNLTLAPKMAGQLLIPPLNLEGAQSKPIAITVSEASEPVHATDKDLFIETSVDKSSAYVQEQVLVSYKFYYDLPVSRLEPAAIQVADIQVRPLPQAEYTANVGHRTYQVAEFKYVVTADKSGDITLPATTWTAYAQDPSASMFGMRGGKQDIHRLKTDELHLKIKPKPASYPAGVPWLPAKALNLDQEWSRKTDQLTQGEPVTRTLTITAEGLAAEQLPPIGENLSISGLKIYPDKPQLDTQTGPNGLSSTRIDSLSVVPNQSGTLEVPAVEITWWDTQADQLRVASLPAQPLLISAASQPSANLPSLPNPAIPQLEPATAAKPVAPAWLYALSGGLALSNLIFIGLWLSARAQIRGAKAPAERKVTTKELWSQVTQALQQQNPKSAREALLLWFQREAAQPFTNLTEIAQWANDPTLAEALKTLDGAIYSSNSRAWQGQLLLDALLSWREKTKSQQAADNDLAPLY
ncbi:MAG TPA: BatD family protein [Marinagarivorans sp.]|nr:BatD family protein [Marinagarivorans sp.]